jgi:hypothetical protein
MSIASTPLQRQAERICDKEIIAGANARLEQLRRWIGDPLAQGSGVACRKQFTEIVTLPA